MAAIGQDHFLILATVCLVFFEDGAKLCLHGLWREYLCPGPTRDGTKLSQETEIKQRGVGDNLIVGAVYPQHGWFVADAGEVALVQVPGEKVLLTPCVPGATLGQLCEGVMSLG